MTRNSVCRILLTGLIFYIHPFCCAAGNEKSAPNFEPSLIIISPALFDTVPDPKKATVQNPPDKPAESIIKEVPKSRKQVKPIAVNTAIGVKPIRIIKPKIINPVIKIH